jgi:hypothetical protein
LSPRKEISRLLPFYKFHNTPLNSIYKEPCFNLVSSKVLLRFTESTIFVVPRVVPKNKTRGSKHGIE